MIPVWLLDIDGVVNACTRKPDRNVWPLDQWRSVRVAVGDHSLPVLAAQPVVDFIRRVHEEGQAEIRWHTTWQKDAACIEAALGMPSLPVQDCPEFTDRHLRDAWFKLAAAERVVMEEGRSLIWTDDDLGWELRGAGRTIDLLREVAPILTISPDDRTGLTPKHLRLIAEFVGLDSERAA